MRKHVPVLLTLVCLLAAAPAFAQLELPRVSPQASVSQTVGLTEVTIDYSRPSVRGRAIFGGLVPYGEVWRTGANEATTISFSDDVTVEGQKLAAGKYSLHTIPGQEQWTIIFNSHVPPGFYSHEPASDVLRVNVRPRTSDHPHELMTFAFPAVTSSSAEIVLAWDRVMVPFTINVDTDARVIAAANAALDWRVPFQAANWAYQNESAATEAMGWIDRSIAIEETWANLALKARMLARAGNRAEAVRFGERALAAARRMPNPPNTAAFEKELASWR